MRKAKTLLYLQKDSVCRQPLKKNIHMYVHTYIPIQRGKVKSLSCTQKWSWNRSVIWNLCHLRVKGRHIWGEAAFQFYIAKHPALQGNMRRMQQPIEITRQLWLSRMWLANWNLARASQSTFSLLSAFILSKCLTVIYPYTAVMFNSAFHSTENNYIWRTPVNWLC